MANPNFAVSFDRKLQTWSGSKDNPSMHLVEQNLKILCSHFRLFNTDNLSSLVSRIFGKTRKSSCVGGEERSLNKNHPQSKI